MAQSRSPSPVRATLSLQEIEATIESRLRNHTDLIQVLIATELREPNRRIAELENELAQSREHIAELEASLKQYRAEVTDARTELAAQLQTHQESVAKSNTETTEALQAHTDRIDRVEQFEGLFTELRAEIASKISADALAPVEQSVASLEERYGEAKAKAISEAETAQKQQAALQQQVQRAQETAQQYQRDKAYSESMSDRGPMF